MANLGGLLGLLDVETEEQRRRREAAGTEAPGVLARIGRGYMDTWEPIQQRYYNAFHPDRAAAYRQQRAEEEALYRKGLLALHPEWSSPDTAAAMAKTLPGSDIYRSLGRSAAAAPFLGGVGAAVANVQREAIFDQAASMLDFLHERGLLPQWIGPIR